MGLDMYLRKSHYVSGYAHCQPKERELYQSIIKLVGAEAVADGNSPSLTMDVTVGYWRKANQVHRWFVENCQSGVDDCGDHHVTGEQLAELRKLCRQALAIKDATILPPIEGFFFGSTNIDDDYWKDLEDTVNIINRALSSGDDSSFLYHSSW